MVPADSALAFERAVEELRARHGALYDDLIASLGVVSSLEASALLNAGADGILVQQGRARLADELLTRAKVARQTLEEHQQRLVAAQRRKATP